MKPFELLLGASALLIAGCSAYFSVLGIAILFAGAALSTGIMAGSLELGKLVVTSFLYRYWHKTSIILKTYLIFAVVVLMFITSLGIFGFLSRAYEKSSSEYGVYTTKIAVLVQQKQDVIDQSAILKADIISQGKIQDAAAQRSTDALKQAGTNLLGSQVIKMQTQNSAVVDNAVKSIAADEAKLQILDASSRDFDNQIVDLKTTSQSSKDIITFQFIADALGLPLDTVVKWFILVIIAVFDPLAVGLILAYNTAIYKHEDDSLISKKKQVVLPPPFPLHKEESVQPPAVSPSIKPEEPITEPLAQIEPPIIENVSAVSDSINKEEEEYRRRLTLTTRLKKGELENFPFEEMPNLTIKT